MATKIRGTPVSSIEKQQQKKLTVIRSKLAVHIYYPISRIKILQVSSIAKITLIRSKLTVADMFTGILSAYSILHAMCNFLSSTLASSC